MNNLLLAKTEKILGNSGGKIFNNLYKLLNSYEEPLEKVTFAYIERYRKPLLVSPKIRFNYTLSQINEIFKGYSEYSQDNIRNLYLLALSICGIKVDDELALSFINAPKEESYRYLRVIATVDNKPITMRVVPNSWGGKDSILTTNFHLKGTDIYLEDKKICTITSWCNLCSINNIAYVSKNLYGENILCVNPLQFCNQGCKFCLRTQKMYSKNRTDELINLRADQLCRYIISELPEVNYQTLNEFYISTGRFRDSKHLLNYLESLYINLKEISCNQFDPVSKEHQWFKVSTHLLDTEEAMIQAQKCGVKKYLYPIEIVCDKKRKKYMASQGVPNNKGDVMFSEIITILDTASKVFGKENIEPVLIIGIDTYEDTMSALLQLKNKGYKTISYNVYRAYYEEQLNLYNMSLEEIVDVTEFIKRNFNQGYKQVVDMNNKCVQKSYISI